MDIVTLGAALNGSAEYVNSHFKGGSNIQIVDNPDGTQTINASGEVSAEDTVARAEIAEMKDGETLDSFGDVETALGDKADTSTTYTKTEVDTALDNKVDKVSGKGLSTNDYTTAEKTKLAGIAEGAEVNEIEGIKVNSSTVNPDVNKVVNITVPTTAADVSALPDTTKYAVALSLTINSSTFVMTGQLKDQNGDNLGTAQTIDLPLESVVVGGSYNSQTKKVVLTLQNGNTIEFSVADLVSGLQTELSASNKLNPAYINYDSTHRAVSDTEKSTWNSKQNALSFDGTYSASTNKAATVSTVTNAVNALDVTGDASVSASKTISAWSETDGKVSISTQDIAIAGTQATLTGYAKSSTAGQAVAATDNVNQAIGKLEATIDDNKNNILLLETINGAKNIVDYAKADLSEYPSTVTGATVSLSGDEWTINGTTNATGTLLANIYFAGATTKLIPNGEYVAQIFPTIENAQLQIITNNIVSNGNQPITFTVTDNDTRSWARLYLANNKTFNNAKIKLMIIPKSLWDAGFTDYQPYAMTNAELTAKEQVNEDNISWNTNNGVKNAAPVSSIEKIASAEGFTVKTNCRLPAGDYIISFDYTSTSSATPAFFNSTGSLTRQLTVINGSGHKSLSFTVTSQDDIAGYYFYTMTAAKFENIMIRPAFIEDDTFEPYAMSNVELTNNISIVDITANFEAATTDYEITDVSYAYRQGKHVFGRLWIYKNSGNFDSQSLEYCVYNIIDKAEHSYPQECFFATSNWKLENTGYGFITDQTHINVRAGADGFNYALIKIDYISQ